MLSKSWRPSKWAITPLAREIAYYNRIKDNLTVRHDGKYALIKEERLYGIFSSYSNAQQAATQHRLSNGDYLLRKI